MLELPHESAEELLQVHCGADRGDRRSGALFFAAGRFPSAPTPAEGKLYMLAINMILVGLPIGVIYWLFHRQRRDEKRFGKPS